MAAKREKPHWGARKIHQRLLGRLPRAVKVPACSTIHEALGMKCPAELYAASPRIYQGIPEPHYPFHDRTAMVTNCGRLCLYRKKISLSKSLASQAVGVEEVYNGIGLVSFMDHDSGYIDLEKRTLEPFENSFGPKVLPMS